MRHNDFGVNTKSSTRPLFVFRPRKKDEKGGVKENESMGLDPYVKRTRVFTVKQIVGFASNEQRYF